jgi:4-carboxymuconolactone decarboxylase
MDDYTDRLRKLALCDEALVAALHASEPNSEASSLEDKTHALVRLSATITVDASQASYQLAVGRALAAGATPDEITGTLLAVVCLTGLPRAVAAAPKLGLALGYDVEAALEGLDNERREPTS